MGHGAAAFKAFTRVTAGYHDPLEIVKATLYLAIAVYSFIAGLRLWQLEPNAPQFAKDFFLISTAAVVLMYVAFYVTGASANVRWLVLHRLLISSLWYLYLSCSDRVRITYGTV